MAEVHFPVTESSVMVETETSVNVSTVETCTCAFGFKSAASLAALQEKFGSVRDIFPLFFFFFGS